MAACEVLLPVKDICASWSLTELYSVALQDRPILGNCSNYKAACLSSCPGI